MLKIFNTITKKKEYFIFPNNKNIKIYVCGITPYYYCHVGHARTFLIFDIIIRYFKYLGYKVIYVRNITDIDDKIIEKSKEKKIKFNELSKYFILKYLKSFEKLNIMPPTYEPKVTNYIKKIINIINILIEKKNAYINNEGDVLFNIKSFNKYGLLSNQNQNFLIKSIKNKYIYKNNFSDFILWKKKKNKNEPSWKSPWGYGRPGWHIECSAISNYFFKNDIDIHGGGIDLLFPHHENEYAQSLCAYENFNIKTWIHIGSVNFLSKKISKSLLNNDYINLNNILNYFNSETIRYYLTNKDYKKPLNFNINLLKKSDFYINKLYNTLLNFKILYKKKNKIIKTEFTQEFIKNMNNDFNVSKIYSILEYMCDEINKIKSNKYSIALNLANEMKNLGSIIGILKKNPFIIKNNKFVENKNFIKRIELLIQKRNIARENKNWKIADKIRLILFKKNIFLEDIYNKTIWKYKK